MFWCILAVGSRRYTEDPTLLASLSARVMDMAIGSIFTMSPEVGIVEGLLLLLTWLFPSTSTCGENTFVMCGSLIHLAMRLGLHVPLSSQDFARTKVRLSDTDLKRNYEVWVHCVVLYARSGSLLKWPDRLTDKDTDLAVFTVIRRYKLLICHEYNIRREVSGTASHKVCVFILDYKKLSQCLAQLC